MKKNTNAVAIPLALWDISKDGKLKKGDLIDALEQRYDKKFLIHNQLQAIVHFMEGHQRFSEEQDNATRNAGDLIDKLTLIMNRKRHILL